VAIPMVDLSAMHEPLRDELMVAITRVIDNNSYILGSEVAEFERAMAAFCNAEEAIGVSSGTAALKLALAVLDVDAGDEVITTPYSFFATVEAIISRGAHPVFVDIEPNSFNIDPDQLEAAITGRTKAILPVHLYGRCADMSRIAQIAERHQLPIIEDACQAIGSEWEGQRAGSIGNLGCFSFFPAKNLGAFGDGGAITTCDAALAERLRALRVHGCTRRYQHDAISGNYRLDAIQAAILQVKLPYVEEWTTQRQDAAFQYQGLFHQHGLVGAVTLPEPGPGRHVYNQYVIRIEDGRRDDVFDHLGKREIGRAVYYPIPLHKQPIVQAMGFGHGHYPEAEKAAAHTLALPIAPGLTSDQQEAIVQAIKEGLNL
jgi:dTDP-4-amino-4,6-dideoxygalactose transaminase